MEKFKMGKFKMEKFKVAVIVGSTRKDSLNRKLGEALARLGAGRFDAVFPRIDDLPLYSQDLEAPLPASVARFKAEVGSADALLFVTPEHNRSVPAALKNAIDWGARPYGTSVWPGKVAAVTGTSPGAIATAVAQQHLRAVLGNQGLLLMGGEAYITYKPDMIDAQGNISDEPTRKFLQAFVDQFTALADKFVPALESAA
jgi:chromate reductase